MSKDTITVSAAKKFNNCPRAYYYRYVAELVKKGEKSSALSLGTAVHDALEVWHRDHDAEAATGKITGGEFFSEYDRAKAVAMFAAYVERYPSEDWEPIALEETITAPLRNPETGRPSRAFDYSGKLDGRVLRADGVYLLEHKTAAKVDTAYLEKLWTDAQIHTYAPASETVTGEHVVGVVYNVLVKPGLRPYKAGKKREADETPEEYGKRCREWCASDEAFHREILFLAPTQIEAAAADLWETVQAVLHAQRRAQRIGIAAWRRNTDRCRDYNRDCDYCPLCRSGGNSLIADTLYEHKQAHSELTTDTAEEPIF